jgi:DNA helicase-2/ATP-dependent DNA helicase PcrA
MVKEQHIPPTSIAALTFTRAAAFELRRRTAVGLPGPGGHARVSTIHSFALRQLLRNWDKVRTLPEPLRIEDDWELRWLILEDLKDLLDRKVKDVRKALNLLAADWHRLKPDEEGWEKQYPDPAFLGAWREHRAVFGYVLRSELVYLLNQALRTFGEKIDLEGPPRHVLVDEFQDLNPCELAVIRNLANRGSVVYVAGDDDQSIYGFRQGYPQGIRQFTADYPHAQELELTVCQRCDKAILELGLFVAAQDYRRLPKTLEPKADAAGGDVHILYFDDQYQEAAGVAAVLLRLLATTGYQPHDVLLLLRSDAKRVFSRPLVEALGEAGLEAAVRTGGTPFDEPDGRVLLSFLRLTQNERDHLAWRTLLAFRHNSVGEKTLGGLYELCRQRRITFCDSLDLVHGEPSLVDRGPRVTRDISAVRALLAEMGGTVAGLREEPSVDELLRLVSECATRFVSDDELRGELLVHATGAAEGAGAGDVATFLRALESASDDIEQEIKPGKVNILTMHKAKGLTARAVVIVGADDELIPGRVESEQELGDERRLLYVSLTRARHHLFATYALTRRDQQAYYGRSVTGYRQLTELLRDGPVQPEDGMAFVRAASVPPS